jgi:hypothetical protein
MASTLSISSVSVAMVVATVVLNELARDAKH